MKTSDNLFQLISLMCKAEKGYFKKYASLHTIGEKNNYVKLFDVIERQTRKLKNYDEQKLKKQFDEKFNRQLPVIKNYLYSALLESLQQYRSIKSPEQQVRDLIEQYDILLDKALTKQASDTLKKAKRVAKDQELFHELLKVLAREKRINRMIKPASQLEEDLRAISAEEEETEIKLKNLNQYINLRYRAEHYILTYGTGFARDEAQKRWLIEFLRNPLLESKDKALSLSALKLYYVKSNIYAYLGETESSFKLISEYAELMEKDVRKSTSYMPLIVALNNFVTGCIRMRKFEEAEIPLNKLKNFEKFYSVSLNINDKAFIAYSQIVMGLSISLDRLTMERGRKIVNEAGRLISGYEGAIGESRLLVIYYFLSSFSFLDENYAEAQKWLAKILQFQATDFSSDYQCYARIMNLIVHYELKNFEHLDYLMKSTYYFLRKRSKIYKYEQIIIKYMKRSLRANSREKLIELFDEMKHELEAIYRDDLEKNAFDAFNILPWLICKIEKIKMTDAVRKLHT